MLEIEWNWTIILQAPYISIYSQMNDEYTPQFHRESIFGNIASQMQDVSRCQTCYLLRG